MGNQTEIKTKLIESPITFLQETKLEPVNITRKRQPISKKMQNLNCELNRKKFKLML